MNLANKITVLRLALTVFIIILLAFPFYEVGITFPKYNVGGVIVEVQYIIAGVIFIIASLTDFIDGYIARSKNMITDLGKMLDAIADKVLVDSSLILLACLGFIHMIIPVIIISRDIVVDAIKMQCAAKGFVVAAILEGKIKTACLMSGVALTYFYNLPFELINIRISIILLYFACIMAIVSAIKYYNMYKKLSEKKNKEN